MGKLGMLALPGERSLLIHARFGEQDLTQDTVIVSSQFACRRLLIHKHALIAAFSDGTVLQCPINGVRFTLGSITRASSLIASSPQGDVGQSVVIAKGAEKELSFTEQITILESSGSSVHVARENGLLETWSIPVRHMLGLILFF
jgi:hypothetical protein